MYNKMFKAMSEQEILKKQDFSLRNHECNNDTQEFRITDKVIKESFLESLQNGYKSYDTYVTASGCDRHEHTIKQANEVKKVTWDPEVIDTEKNTFRSGYQAKGTKNQTSDLDLILKGNRDPRIKNKNNKIYGNSNGANGHNGLAKSNLYLATYLNTDGVGNNS